MSTLSDTRFHRFVGPDSIARTLLAALALLVGGSVLGIVGAAVVPSVARLVVDPAPDPLYLLTSRGVQFGFGAFALAYLAWTDSWERYARFRVPSLRDLGWVLGALVGFALVGTVNAGLFDLLGVATGTGTDGTRGIDVAARPLLWPAVLLAWFCVATPAEELFYRGVVFGRVRDRFDAVGAVLVGGALFGLSHVLFVALGGGSATTLLVTMVELSGAGVVFCAVYERTENLVVVAVAHAVSWLEAYHRAGHALIDAVTAAV